MSTEPIRILCMEDDAGAARLFQKRLERFGYQVKLAADGEMGLAMYDPALYQVLAVDHHMPGREGLEVIRELAQRGPLPPTIMITGNGSEPIAVEAMKLGASDYVVKDTQGGYLDLLPAVIEQVLDKQRLAQEKQRAAEALEQHARELETRNEELDTFAHTVAHDIKSPLTAIIGTAQFLMEERQAISLEQEAQGLETIVRSGRKMSNLIDELQLLAGVRQVDAPIRPLDMAATLEEARARLDYLIRQHQAEIALPAIWPPALGYAPWVEEIWVNYLSNAIQYGGRPPRVEVGATQASEGMACFWVRDNGRGLTREEQARLFTPFTRLDQAHLKGYGLGLSIVRRIVEKLGGQAAVVSTPGRGSVFTFTLPMP